MTFTKTTKILFLFVVLGSMRVAAASDSFTDSIRNLKEVVVTAKTYREVIPAQRLAGAELKSLNSFSVADAIRYFAGVQIKDFGGIGGLKTVNVRSMGTNHLGVFYDGIQLGNAQNGQIDLGKFSLDNIESISLYNGQKSEIFQAAKDYGSAGTIYLRSRIPVFENKKTQNLKLNFKTGSFDLVNPAVLWEKKLTDALALALNTEYIASSGKYNYRYRRVHPATHETVYDTTAVRANGDIGALRIEGGLYGKIADGKWNLKTYFYNSERGIPGAIVNNIWKNSQRQWDRNFFTQASWQKAISEKFETQVNLKYAHDYMRYLNPDTTLLYIDNNFAQQEFYISSANKYAITRNWEISLSGDFQWNTLDANLSGFASPTRFTTMIAAATAIEMGSLKMQGSVLGTLTSDHTRNHGIKTSTNKNELSPALFASWKPFAEHDLNFRAFYKNIFRMPTFNDLYYTDIGNANLLPERAHQFDLGAQYAKYYKNGTLRYLQMQLDAYYNRITNKIIAVPKGSGMYRWMMMNIGLVEIRGIDFSGATTLQIAENTTANLKATYTFQKAQDFTERKNAELQQLTWGGQIPYIPWHNGSIIVGTTHKTWSLNYSFVYVGERYHNSANIAANHEQPWYTHDMNIVKNFHLNEKEVKLSLEVNNIFSQDYEVVLNYPMPKRNFKLSMTLQL